MLTDLQCKKAVCPQEKKRARFVDEGGLYLEVAPNGSKRWFWKFYADGKEKRLAVGSYPEVSLKDARSARDKARQVKRTGIDPAKQRQIQKLAGRSTTDDSFEAVAREFHKIKKGSWSERYGERWLSLMERDAFPWLGRLAMRDITAPMLLQVLRRAEGRGAHEVAHTLRQWCGQAFRHGIATGKCIHNPAPDLHGALMPVNVKHMAAVLEPKKAGELMRAIADYTGQPSTRCALLLSALLFQRPGNMRQMLWADVDLEAAMWTIPAADMKRRKHEKENGRPHLVPLATQAVQALRDLHPLTGHGSYVFPSLLTGERPMSENTVNTALRRMGYSNTEMTAHGFRAMARTIMVEQMDVEPEVIEAQLAHGKSGPLGAAYDRAEFVVKRRKMMQLWADHLDELRQGAKILAFKAA